jgi:hypothetical protein
LHQALSQFGGGWLFRRFPFIWPDRKELFAIALFVSTSKGTLFGRYTISFSQDTFASQAKATVYHQNNGEPSEDRTHEACATD